MTLTPFASRRPAALACRRRAGAGKGRALRHLHDRHPAHHRPARSRRLRLRVHRPHDLRPADRLGLDVTDRPGKMIPGLATEWSVNEADKTLWTFKLRAGVKFHDGSAFDADAVIWNLDKIFNKDCPQFDTRQSVQVRPRLPSLASYRKTGDMAVEIKTKSVDSLFPYQLLWFLVSSPAQWERVGRDWNKFARSPPGTGPFKLTRLVPRERAELVKNDAYWNAKRVPKVDRIVLMCVPEDSGRSAALLLGHGRHDRRPGAGHARPPEAVRRPHLDQHHAARLPVPSLAGRGLAVGRHPGAQGREPRDRPRCHRQAAQSAGEAGLRRGRQQQPVVRQADLRAELRARRGAQADGRGGLFQGQADDGAHLDSGQRHHPDGQRSDPGDAEGVLHRHRVQADRARDADDRLARRRQGRHEQGRDGDQRHARHVRSGLRRQPLLRLRSGGADRGQLERLQEPRDRQARGRDRRTPSIRPSRTS